MLTYEIVSYQRSLGCTSRRVWRSNSLPSVYAMESDLQKRGILFTRFTYRVDSAGASRLLCFAGSQV